MPRSLPALVAARLACGLAAGWIIPLAMAFLGDVIPYERRQQVLGRSCPGRSSASCSARPPAACSATYFGWRNVFFFLAALLRRRHPRAVATNSAAIRSRTRATPPRTRSRGFVADYATVLRSPWARVDHRLGFIESAFMFGAFTYVGADLHLRFGVSFTLVGLFVGAFAIGGLIYSLSVRMTGAAGSARSASPPAAAMMLAVAYIDACLRADACIAPFAITAIGLGFYMLHNTLQTNATQMTPEARGTAVAMFSSALYLGQTAGRRHRGIVFDRFTAVPVFVIAAIGLLALGCGLRKLRRHAQKTLSFRGGAKRANPESMTPAGI